MREPTSAAHRAWAFALAALVALTIAASGCVGSSAPTPAATHHSISSVQVPKTQGDERDAAMQLYQAGLRVRILHAWQANSFPGELVNVVTPRQGTPVKPGTVATVQMDSAVGSQWWVPGSHRMPALVGRPLEQAQLALHRSSLPWRVFAAPLPPTRTPDILGSYCIVAQVPRAGETIVIRHSLVWVTLAAAPCARGNGSGRPAWPRPVALPRLQPGRHPVVVVHVGGETTRSNVPPTAQTPSP
jgi:beta-lactam-binding protein with PASTA domain